MLLNNQWATEKNKEKMKKIPEDKWTWKHNFPKSMGHSKSSSKKFTVIQAYLNKQEKSQINNLNSHLKN